MFEIAKRPLHRISFTQKNNSSASRKLVAKEKEEFLYSPKDYLKIGKK